MDWFLYDNDLRHERVKEEKFIRCQHELFGEKSKKNKRPGKYQKINYNLYLWYQRCCASNIYPNGPMLKEEEMMIKESLQSSGGKIHGKVLTPLKKVELLVRLEMLQKKQLHPGWKEFRN